ncbi:MAG: hypothetical protein LBQ56_02420 [Synergistaceae bacterium]|nr:hypothetical protein [Synergistaceae bacterium]
MGSYRRSDGKFFLAAAAGALALLVVIMRAEPLMASPPSIPYGGYNVTSSVGVGLPFYPDEVKGYFDDRSAGAGIHSPTLDRMASSSGSVLGQASDEQGEIGRVTTNEELNAFIDGLPRDYMRRLSLGKFPSYSAAGDYENAFETHLLIFSNPPSSDAHELKGLGRPIIYLQGGIHGNESSGTEALLAIASDLASGGESFLEKVSVIILPRLNMDGAWRYQRGTNSVNPGFGDMDQNRDAVSVITPQMRAVRNMLTVFRPDVAIDLHEMGYRVPDSYTYTATGGFAGYTSFLDNDIATLAAHPYNVPSEVTGLAYELQRGIRDDLASVGLKASTYFTPASMVPGYGSLRRDFGVTSGVVPGGYMTYPSMIMEGAPDESISDSAVSLLPSVSLLFETRMPQVLVNYRTRVYAHYSAARSVISQVAARPSVFLDAVASGAAETAAMGEDPESSEDIVLWVRQEEAAAWDIPSVTIARDGVSADALTVEKLYRNDSLTPVMSVKRPYAYVISADEAESDAIASRLALTGVAMSRLGQGVTTEAEAYKIESVVPSTDPGVSYEARSCDYMPKDNSPITYAINAVSSSTGEATFRGGSYLFLMADPSANLAALAVEPMANCNLGNYWLSLSRDGKGDASGFIRIEEGGEYPVYRLAKPVDLPLVPVTSEMPFVSGAYVPASRPFNPADADADAAFGYSFTIADPVTGRAPEAFRMELPTARNGVPLRSWSLYDWSSSSYEESPVGLADGVPVLDVSSRFISADGHVLAIAHDRAPGVIQNATASSGGGCTANRRQILIAPIALLLASGMTRFRRAAHR